MRRAAWLLGLALLAGGAAPATAASPPQAVGAFCQFMSLASGTADPDQQSALLWAGPMVVTVDGVPVHASVRCVIRRGLTHADPELASAESPTMPGVVVLTPSVVTYTASPVDWVDVCSELRVEGGAPFYWDDVAGEWTTDPDVPCRDWGEPDPEPDPFEKYVDPLVCPVFAAAFPPEGDVVLPVLGAIWDCPPYGNV